MILSIVQIVAAILNAILFVESVNVISNCIYIYIYASKEMIIKIVDFFFPVRKCSEFLSD